ncbi:MAG: rRNA (cytidine1920-2-O)/16S rRNA (cytidine1409-2-O)-methyltransferase [Clostridiales bacterium]|nr:rRNA (cytidine1920-2-O)/16S rRNA (cytidine1409-2-O)-methyltransferase [Clostridiales bacterium]MDK2933374.1 rRNA (cytidine1920-2-O)/16S rRNA (cytidine1409-2-O)-methyltransferase [Clostridiales bacterium]
MSDRQRIDVLLTERGFVESREKAKSLLMSGQVYIDDQKVDKAGTKVDINSKIEIRGSTLSYVSRGGLKLEKALKQFNINIHNKVAIDIGASTGGFTDCMLQNGAKKVYAIDVGYGQLAWRLRQDSRVINMERTNIRYVDLSQIGEEVDFISIDVAFISLKLVLPVAKNLLKTDGEIVCLIKPQFEAGREKVGKKGVVRDKQVHFEVIKMIVSFTRSIGLSVFGLNFSPIKGPEGNIEYLLYLKKVQHIQEDEYSDSFIYDIVEQSHQNLE